jgi:hypothetical protein
MIFPIGTGEESETPMINIAELAVNSMIGSNCIRIIDTPALDHSTQPALSTDLIKELKSQPTVKLFCLVIPSNSVHSKKLISSITHL